MNENQKTAKETLHDARCIEASATGEAKDALANLGAIIGPGAAQAVAVMISTMELLTIATKERWEAERAEPEATP